MPRQLQFDHTEAFDNTYAKEILNVPVSEELSESFLAYSLSVITARAIPDVRDGLKPVQRRIFWSMLQMGVRPGTPFRKSARIVGDTMGRYHPHGDAAIYDTLVRMGQDFSRMLPFIEPQGNFGSLDDPPAASRYTECRLAAPAMDMVRELDEDTVDFRPTYDGEGEEPTVLPAAVPNIIVNGSSGIAVGMATNMAPHNLRETAALIRLVMTKRRPKPTIEEIMAVLPGPDFPSGATVVNDGLREAYATGRGSFRIRATAHQEQVTRSRYALIVTELPYLVGPERVISKVQELTNNGKLTGVADITDLSDIGGLRIQIDLKPGIDPQSALRHLYRLTPLEETFGINNVVLVDGVPTTLGIYELCLQYIKHRLEVIVRRTRHRLAKAQDRLHILEGLLIALDAIDEVVAIIRSSKDAAQARVALIERFLLTDIQAAHILDMPLRRLTALAKLELNEEATQLRIDIEQYHKLLGSETARRNLLIKELDELTAAHGTPRRTEIVTADSIETSQPAEPVAPKATNIATPCVVTLSTSGNIGRAPTDTAKRAKLGRHDLIAARAMTQTNANITALSSSGRAFTMAVYELPEATNRTRGTPLGALLGLPKGERVLTLLTESEERLMLVTAAGITKRMTLSETLATESGATLIPLNADDYLVAAFRAPLEADIAIVASDGQVLRTSVEQFSDKGRGVAGVAGMRLLEDAKVVGADALLGDGVLLTVTSGAAVKATQYSELRSKGRGGQGVRHVKLASGESVSATWFGPATMTDVYALMADYEDPRKQDPNPLPLSVEPTARGLVARRGDRQVLVVADSRW